MCIWMYDLYLGVGQIAHDLEEGSNQRKRMQLVGLLSPPAAGTQAAGYNRADAALRARYSGSRRYRGLLPGWNCAGRRDRSRDVASKRARKRERLPRDVASKRARKRERLPRDVAMVELRRTARPVAGCCQEESAQEGDATTGCCQRVDTRKTEAGRRLASMSAQERKKARRYRGLLPGVGHAKNRGRSQSGVNECARTQEGTALPRCCQGSKVQEWRTTALLPG